MAARKLVGVVTSDARDKTITVHVSRRVTHPVYRKQYTVSDNYAAHDDANKAHIGERGEIIETRPISKTKTLRLSQILETGHAAVEIKEEG